MVINSHMGDADRSSGPGRVGVPTVGGQHGRQVRAIRLANDSTGPGVAAVAPVPKEHDGPVDQACATDLSGIACLAVGDRAVEPACVYRRALAVHANHGGPADSRSNRRGQEHKQTQWSETWCAAQDGLLAI